MEELTSQNQQPAPQSNQQPGPVFEAGPGWGGKLKKNFTKIVLSLIVVLVVAMGLIMFLNRGGEETKISLPEIETEKIQEVEQVSIEETVTETGQTGNVYKAAAQSGEGITHLARRTLKEYLDKNPSVGSGLTVEHKIYIEDYLKDLRGERFLALGEEIEFSADEITAAIETAERLSGSQLSNLSQYLPLVSGI